MQFKGRSLYNLLQVSAKEDPSIEVKPWQILDYRTLSEEELFAKINSVKISLDKDTFLLYGENMETPEELSEHLYHKEEEGDEEQEAYLSIFELWRRIFPAKESLSIFFDSLDQIIADFDGGLIRSDGGLMLLQKVDEQLGLTKRLAAGVADERDPVRIKHTLEEMFAQRRPRYTCEVSCNSVSFVPAPIVRMPISSQAYASSGAFT